MIYAIWQKNIDLVTALPRPRCHVESSFMQGARPLMVAAGLGNLK